MMKRFAVALTALLALTVLGLDLGPRPEVVHAGSPGTIVSTLVDCPNLDGSSDNGVRVSDILMVVNQYFKDWPSLDYMYLTDLDGPYNPETGSGGQQRVGDILAVVGRYFATCPQVDTEVAQATLWARDNAPVTQDDAALAAIGYIRGSTDVPGQGVHYVKLDNWDGTFDPAAPEGLVYDNGRLAAQLFVVDGNVVGWLEDYQTASPGPCWDGIDNGGDTVADAADPDCGSGDPTGDPLDDIHIDPICDPAAVGAGGAGGVLCSWFGDEGWHLHYRLCTFHIGTVYAVAVPLAPGSDAQDCKDIHNSTCCGGTWFFNLRVGWMGHLWNHLPNANRIPDYGGTLNGRFADCYPDGGVWGPYNCPQ